jgi:N6-adenosine-specific RNA methylase IME4
MSGYAVILADPPWRYEHVKTKSRTIENHYPTMTLADICALPVAGLAAPDAVLFLWATCPKLAEAMEVMRAWDFTYRTKMEWVKPQIGMGYWVRAMSEPLLIGVRGKMRPPLPARRPGAVIHAPRLKHSAKPPEMHERLERLYPEARRVELFARAPREGWDVWGNEVASDLDLRGAA